MPVSLLTGQVIDVRDIFGPACLELESRLIEAVDDSVRLALLSDFLRKRMKPLPTHVTMVSQAVGKIIAAKGNCSVALLAGEGYLSERQFERIFRAAVGISPKSFSGIVRFQHSIQTLQSGTKCSLSDVAYKNGYYDLAHFNHDFRKFSGASPSQYFAAEHPMADLFTGI